MKGKKNSRLQLSRDNHLFFLYMERVISLHENNNGDASRRWVLVVDVLIWIHLLRDTHHQGNKSQWHKVMNLSCFLFSFLEEVSFGKNSLWLNELTNIHLYFFRPSKLIQWGYNVHLFTNVHIKFYDGCFDDIIFIPNCSHTILWMKIPLMGLYSSFKL